MNCWAIVGASRWDARGRCACAIEVGALVTIAYALRTGGETPVAPDYFMEE
jgi:hypothetical protein